MTHDCPDCRSELEKDTEYDPTALDEDAPWWCPECEEVWRWEGNHWERM